MKILKSPKEIQEKRAGGMEPDEEIASYLEYKTLNKNPSGAMGDVLEVEYKTGNKETFYCWVFYPEDLAVTVGKGIHPEYIEKELEKTKPKKKKTNQWFKFETQLEQERYEWFCGGWVQFYDDILRPEEIGGKEHKLFFYWDRFDVRGVAIYINDEYVNDPTHQINLKYDKNKKQLIYTAPPAVSDPPTVPPPPPPTKR